MGFGVCSLQVAVLVRVIAWVWCVFCRWQFMSEGNDIGFGVFRRTADERQKAGEMVEVVTSERVNSHMVPEDGSIVCDTPGTCKL